MKKLITFISAIALTLSSASGFSSGRDSDGSRMQARSLTLGTVVKDHISPPSDAIDWHFFRIKKAKNVQITLSSSQGSAKISLSNSVGKTMASGGTKRGRFMVSQKLEAGIYYISVSGQNSLSYSLSVK